MKRLEVSGAVRPLYGSLGVKGLIHTVPSKTTVRYVQRYMFRSLQPSRTNVSNLNLLEMH